MRIRTLLCFFLFLAAYATAQDTDFATGPQYLLTGSPLLAHSIATPSLSMNAPLPPVEASSINTPEPATPVPYTTNPQLQNQANLIPIYYGEPNYFGVTNASVVEIDFSSAATETVAALPASIAESEVTQLSDAQTLRVRGYGIPLGDVAAYWKTHKTTARRTFTNESIKQLHSAS